MLSNGALRSLAMEREIWPADVAPTGDQQVDKRKKSNKDQKIKWSTKQTLVLAITYYITS